MAVLTFGEFRLDTVDKRLWRGTSPVELTGIYFSVLCHLAERSAEAAIDPGGGPLVTKREIREQFWRDAQVSEETLRSCMSAIRKALGDDGQQARYIKTQSREGWRFMMKVVSMQPKPKSTGRRAPPPGVPYDPEWYVERPQEEKDILDCIKHPGRPVVVYGPRNCGKTLLISRALESACAGKQGEPPCRVIRVNMRSLAEDYLGTLDGMLQEFGRRLLDPEDMTFEQALATVSKLWAKPIDGMLKLKRLVRNHVLQPGHVVYLVLVNAEHLAPWPHQAAWFDMLRAWQEADDLSGLRLIVETALPPRLFSFGGHSPLWTKSRRVPVERLDTEQIVRMAEFYELQPSLDTCARLGDLVGGLAMLCASALYYASLRQKTLEEVLNEYRAKRRVDGPFKDHLEDIDHWLYYEQKAARDTPTKKYTSVERFKEAARGITLSLEEAWPAVRKGILAETEERGVYRLRCRLYEDFFAEYPS